MNIPDFFEISPAIWTSGQPTPEDFPLLARNGVEMVVNLIAPESPAYNPDEAKLVIESGMQYAHLPVSWTTPKVEDFMVFESVLRGLGGRKVLVHCARNMRVSAFMYLFRVLVAGENAARARIDLENIWEPDAVWDSFIKQVIFEFKR